MGPKGDREQGTGEKRRSGVEDSGVESGHVRRPQAARSTGRPQYHGGRRGMRDEDDEEEEEEERSQTA